MNNFIFGNIKHCLCYNERVHFLSLFKHFIMISLFSKITGLNLSF